VKIALLIVALLNLLASCVANTPTTPPDAHMPQVYRGVVAPDASSLAAIPWRKVYDDPVLQALIAQALKKNLTVEQSYAAILAAEANLAITRGNQFPQVNATLQAPYEITGGQKTPITPDTAFTPSLAVGASYEFDLLGKLSSATAVSRAQLMSTEWAQETLFSSLVSQVASAYFQMLGYDELLDITQRSAKVRAENVRLMKLRVDYGQSSLQDLRQSQQGLLEVTEQIPELRQNIIQTENAISVLTGDYPHDIPRGFSLKDQVKLPELPPTGIPSELLTRRPDIVEAEYNLVAADAQIDVARKMLYPSITLGASAAVSGSSVTGIANDLPFGLSSGVNGKFFGPSGVFTLLPQLTQPIFTGGKLKANVRLTEAQQQQLVYSYLLTVQQAFQEVANSVTAYNQQRLHLIQTDLYTAASLDSTRLAYLRYDEGQTSYLEVLNAETRSYQAESDSIQSRLSVRLALVQLYLALGGGWQV
jgi:multidrug efflux system outer membrane protein